MRQLPRYPLLAAAFLAISTGCASFQTDEGATLLPQTDYIDDRIDDNLEQMIDEEVDQKFDERFDDELDSRIEDQVDEEFDEEVDEQADRRLRRERYLDSLPLRQITLHAGYRNFTDGAVFGRVDDEVALGIEYAHEIQDGLGFEVGALGSLGTTGGLSGDTDVSGAAAELYGGARYTYKDLGDWRPYAGVGLSALIAGVDNDEGGQVADDQDFTFGVYVHAGIQYDITDALFLSVDVRSVLATDLDLDTVSGDADYFQLALGFGFNL